MCGKKCRNPSGQSRLQASAEVYLHLILTSSLQTSPSQSFQLSCLSGPHPTSHSQQSWWRPPSRVSHHVLHTTAVLSPYLDGWCPFLCALIRLSGLNSQLYYILPGQPTSAFLSSTAKWRWQYYSTGLWGLSEVMHEKQLAQCLTHSQQWAPATNITETNVTTSVPDGGLPLNLRHLQNIV